mmetsp:Transcript_12503/g.34447  ORF Transcript_12503/g.34447 Transcript_12503/m.34447 type:complete len:243 (+) Transcript_12503:307-1035(+)
MPVHRQGLLRSIRGCRRPHRRGLRERAAGDDGRGRRRAEQPVRREHIHTRGSDHQTRRRRVQGRADRRDERPRGAGLDRHLAPPGRTRRVGVLDQLRGRVRTEVRPAEAVPLRLSPHRQKAGTGWVHVVHTALHNVALPTGSDPGPRVRGAVHQQRSVLLPGSRRQLSLRLQRPRRRHREPPNALRLRRGERDGRELEVVGLRNAVWEPVHDGVGQLRRRGVRDGYSRHARPGRRGMARVRR